MNWISEIAANITAEEPNVKAAVSRAVAAVRRVLEANPDRLSELLEPIVKAACVSAIAIARHNRRSAAIAGAVSPTAPGLSLVVASNTAMLAMPIGNKRLGDCTASDLLAHAAMQRRQAAGHERMAVFVERVAQRVGANVVKDVETEDSLRELMRNVHNAVRAAM